MTRLVPETFGIMVQKVGLSTVNFSKGASVHYNGLGVGRRFSRGNTKKKKKQQQINEIKQEFR